MAMVPPGPQQGGINVGAVVQLLQQIAQAINTLNVTLAAIFPEATATISHSATAGGDTLPANPSGFITVMIDGVAYKVALYNV